MSKKDNTGIDVQKYREKIVKMVNEIENDDYIFKIYHYILAKYRRSKKKEAET